MRILTIILAALSLAPAGMAALVYPSVTPEGGNFAYEYTVQNDTADEIIGFRLIIPIVPLDVRAPLSWFFILGDAGGMTTVEWFAEDVGILPSETLSGFGITSSPGPGLVAFAAITTTFTDSGTTTGPTEIQPIQPIPEPGTFALLSGGLIAAGAFRRYVVAR